MITEHPLKIHPSAKPLLFIAILFEIIRHIKNITRFVMYAKGKDYGIVSVIMKSLAIKTMLFTESFATHKACRKGYVTL